MTYPPRTIIAVADRKRLALAALKAARARDTLAWTQEELEDRYGLRPDDRVDWLTGEVFSSPQTIMEDLR